MFMYVKAVKVSKLYNVWYLVSKNLKEIVLSGLMFFDK